MLDIDDIDMDLEILSIFIEYEIAGSRWIWLVPLPSKWISRYFVRKAKRKYKQYLKQIKCK